MPRLLLGLTTAGFATALVLVPAIAQTRDQIRQQNEELFQQQQEQLQQQQSTNPTAPPLGEEEQPPATSGSLTIQLLDRVNRLEDQVRTLRGRVDELQNDLQTQEAGLNKQIGDLSFALQQGHAAPSGNFATSRPPPAAVPATPPPDLHRTPEAALRGAHAALARHDYAGAADLARQALSSGGTHTVQAQFVLAEALSGQGNHGGAAAAYYTAYTKQPTGPFASDALLQVGSSLIATGDTNAACEALGELRAKFPTARPGILRQASYLRTRAHCH